MRGLTLTTKEQSRIQVLNGVIEGKVTVVQSAKLMRVSERHAWRLLAAYREEGVAAVAHGNRGRKPSTSMCQSTQQRVDGAGQRPLCRTQPHPSDRYAGRASGCPSVTIHRQAGAAGGGRAEPPSPPSPQTLQTTGALPPGGTLLQIDGSRHDWLEGRGPYLTLVGAADDATGTVPFALFRRQEDAQGYMLMLRETIEHHGVPLALYSDRHGIFQRSPKELESLAEQLRGRRDPTQFARALEELDIGLILAHTPQAKGRIERVWGTFQDRLVSELRLAGATTIDQANNVLWDFLPRSTRLFGVPAIRAGLGLPPTSRRDSASMPSCASSTSAPWPTTTPCGSTATLCS